MRNAAHRANVRKLIIMAVLVLLAAAESSFCMR